MVSHIWLNITKKKFCSVVTSATITVQWCNEMIHWLHDYIWYYSVGFPHCQQTPRDYNQTCNNTFWTTIKMSLWIRYVKLWLHRQYLLAGSINSQVFLFHGIWQYTSVYNILHAFVVYWLFFSLKRWHTLAFSRIR